MVELEKEARRVEEIYKNLISELNHNFRILSPPGGRMFSSHFDTSYFDSIRNSLHYLPTDLSDDLKELYEQLREANLYIAKLGNLDYQEFRSRYWDESRRLDGLTPKIIEAIQRIKQDIKSRLGKLEQL
jgi:hypothetical protein